MIDKKDEYRSPVGFTESNIDTIKENLIREAKKNDIIKDYDFKGSVGNALINTEAYAILKNQLLANIAILENNIYTAKDRRSIVQHAQNNGYIPSGVTSSKLTIGLVCTNRNQDPSIKVPRGTKFQGQQTDSGHTYRFVTLDDVNAIRGEGGTYTPTVRLAQGRIIRIETTYDKDIPLIIKDELIDRNEIRLWVDNAEWKNWTYNNVVDVTGGSSVFYTRETYDSETEIRFGVGEVSYAKAGNYRINNYIGGKKPVDGSKIVIEYLRTEGKLANGCKIFTFNDVIRDTVVERLVVNYNNDPNFIGSYGGGDIEDKESIRENGILSGETQRRAVTDTDWKTILDRKYSPIIQARQVFNPPGAQNIVSIVIKPKGALALTTDQNRDIREYLSQFIMGRFKPVIQKPNYIFIHHDINVQFSANELSESKDWLEERIIENITSFYKKEVEFFNTPLHKSKLTTAVDNSHYSIKGSSAKLKLVREVESFYQTTYLGISFYNRVKQGTFKSNKFSFISNPDRDTREMEESHDIFIQGAKRDTNKSIIVAGPFLEGEVDKKYKPYTGNDIIREEIEIMDGGIANLYYEIGTIDHTNDVYEWSFGVIGFDTKNFIDPFIEIFVEPENDSVVDVNTGSLIIYEYDLRPQYTKFTWTLSN